ncbi:TPA: BrnT family toxin [Serratia marcescens]
MYVYFEWNQDKNHSNQRKHRVSFEIAQRVFLDPNHLAVLESRGRRRTLANARYGRLLFVAAGGAYDDRNGCRRRYSRDRAYHFSTQGRCQ